MQSTSKEFILEHLSFLTEKAELALERTSNVHCANDFIYPLCLSFFTASRMT